MNGAKRKRRFWPAAVCVAGLLAVWLVSGCGRGEPTFVVALKPDRDPDAMLEEQRTLGAFLREEVDRRVNVIVPMSGAVIHEGLANGTIDISFVSSTDAVRAMDAGVGEVLLASEINGRPYYESYWITLREKTYFDVEDLRGQPIAFSSRTSTSGMQVPVWDLVKRGLLRPDQSPEAFFGEGNVFYGTGYVSAARRVLDGQAEAAAVSYYVLDKDKHLSEDERERLRKVVSQGPVPTHVLVVRATLPEEDKALLRDAFKAMNDGAEELRDTLFTGPLVEVDPVEHLAPTREVMNLIREMPL
ncbi:MAG: phosphate/phosphite/phosphonate ABC transporter substrate-binding protein [Opitutales bacterium]|nr:phosphate/phosphite/phosphonate ABC transporter substrate-binding protein [Opitutales bacterium]